MMWAIRQTAPGTPASGHRIRQAQDAPQGTFVLDTDDSIEGKVIAANGRSLRDATPQEEEAIRGGYRDFAAEIDALKDRVAALEVLGLGRS